jgi:TPR repeat protein
MMTSLRLFIAVTTLSALPGCIDPPKSPYVDVHGLVTRIDESRAIAEQGSAEDQYQLGLRYEQARPLDPREAIYWYRVAAMQRHAEALYRLCLLSDLGRGLPQDFYEAMRWCRLAVDQSHSQAMFMMGTYYDKARAVSRDVVQAHRWYNLASAYGYHEGAKRRDRLARDMTPGQIAEAQLLARNWRPKTQEILHE